MPKGKVREGFIMRQFVGEAEHPLNGEKIEISTHISSGMPIIRYKGKYVVWNIQDILNEAVELIDALEKSEEVKGERA